MYKNFLISVVIPCHNEETTISGVIGGLPSWVDEIIIVDNNSTDSTSFKAENAGAKIVKETMIGYGSAYKAGFATAKGEIIATLDGDGQYDSRQVKNLVDHLIDQQVDFVTGNRIKNWEKPEGLSWLRYIGNHGLSLVTMLFFGRKIMDSQSGMWAFRKAILEKIDLRSNGMAFSEEIKIKAILNKYKYSELPINYTKRQGNSKLSIVKDGITNLLYLFKLFLQYRKKKIFKGLFWLATLGLVIFLLFSTSGIPGGDDGYRHIKFASLIRQYGWMQASNYPWLTQTFPSNHPVDLWLLYHFFLIPFTLISSLILALKVSTLALTISIAVLFYFILGKLKVLYREFWIAILLFGNQDFLFRLTLGRALLLNITFLLVATLILFKNKYPWLIIIAALFILNNVAAVMLLPLVITYIVSDYIINKKLILSPLIFVIIGISVGLLVHPQFPYNLSLGITQIFNTQFTAVGNHISVGREIYPYAILEFLQSNALLLILWLSGVCLFIVAFKNKKLNLEILFTFLFSIVTFILTLKSRRFIEYYAPFSLLFAAVAFRQYLVPETSLKFKKVFTQFKEFKIAFFVVTIILISWFGYTYQHQLSAVKTSPSGIEFKGVSEWLNVNSNPGEIIFNTQWDSFPQMFFYNANNYYLVGIDPTFAYIKDPAMYKKWLAITDENPELWEDAESIYGQIKNNFHASYIVIESARNPNLQNFLKNNTLHYNLVYEDNSINLFKVN